MRLTYVALGVAAVAVIVGCADTAGPAESTLPTLSSTSPDAPAPTGRLIVKFGGAPPADFPARVAAIGGTVDWVSEGAGLATISGVTEKQATRLAGRGVTGILPDVAIHLNAPEVADIADALGAPDTPESQQNPATSFFFARQWHLRAIGADAAWAAGFRGAASTDVFILDTGIDYTHADLTGLVDLNRSRDLLGIFQYQGAPFNEAALVQQNFPGRLPFTDLFYHGTHVAATVSSKAVATAGVASQVTLVAVKVCAVVNVCPFSSVINGVIYAADNGADVINLSLGGTISKAGNGSLVSLINTVFNYARSKGSTIVTSAGNSAIDMDHDGNSYKNYCNTPAAICVSATGPTAQAGVNGPWTNIDAPATYTNYGRSAINVAAPGGNAASFVYAACSRTSLLIPVCQTGTFVVGVAGTSMASPHVAGAAALLVEQLGRNPAAIRARLEQTADDLGQSGTDPFYGKGRLNVARAVGAIP